MNRARLWRLPAAVGMLACSIGVRAQLPDLRGKTLFVVGTLRVGGSALTFDVGSLFPDGIALTEAYPGRIVIGSGGDAANTMLTTALPIPNVPSTVAGFATCPNPVIPLTGSFNRSTGTLNFSGILSGTSIVDFGVHDTGTFGVKRILVQTRNIGFSTSSPITGTGTIDADGAFRIRQPGDTDFSFDKNGNIFNGTPRVGLQNPSSCSFGGTQATINNASLKLSNWTAMEPTASGTITLQECASAAVPLTFEFRNLSGAVLFTRTITPAVDGAFFVPNIPVGNYNVAIKGSKWLRKVVPVDVTEHFVSGLQITLPGGDSNGDNSADALDLADLISSFNISSGEDGYNDAADFNCDSSVDALDLAILITNFNTEGDL